MFNFALENDYVAVNPATHIKPPTEEEARDRFLTDDEIRTLWSTLDGWGDVPTRNLFRLALLTRTSASPRDAGNNLAGELRASISAAAPMGNQC